MRRWNWLCGGMSVRGFVVFDGEEGMEVLKEKT